MSPSAWIGAASTGAGAGAPLQPLHPPLHPPLQPLQQSEVQLVQLEVQLLQQLWQWNKLNRQHEWQQWCWQPHGAEQHELQAGAAQLGSQALAQQVGSQAFAQQVGSQALAQQVGSQAFAQQVGSLFSQQAGAEQQLELQLLCSQQPPQHPFPSIRSKSSKPKLWPQRPTLRISVPKNMFHFIEQRLLYS